MSIIKTIKNVVGTYFKGNITDNGFEMTHFKAHQPAVNIMREPNYGWSDGMKPVGNADFLRGIKVKQNFAVLTVGNINEMIQELQIIKKEMEQ